MEEKSILIVEDEAIAAVHLTRLLSCSGYRVTDTVPTGEKAIQAAKRDAPDLYLIDIRLAGSLDGIETATILQTICDSPVVFITANSDQETLKRASVIGPFGYILKPFDDRDLRTQLTIAQHMHQADRRVRASEERWQLALRGSTDGIWDWDILNHTVFLSARWKKMRGYEEDEISLDETEWTSHIHPEDRPRVLQTVKAYLKKDTSDYQCEYRSRRKDGTYLWILDRGVAVWDSRGPVRMVGSETDITARREAEQALLESQERLTGVVTTAMDAIISVDGQSRITLFNQAAEQLFGCRASEAIGARLDRFIPERFRHDHSQYMAEFGHTGTTARRMGRFGTVYGLRSNGEEFPLEASISKLEIKGMKFYTVILRDITERKQQEDTLRRWSDDLENRIQERTRELVTSQQQLRAFATELTLTEQRERKRLATELHDHLAQLLVLARLKISQVKRSTANLLGPEPAEMLQQAEDALAGSLDYTRTLVADLTPPILHEFGLVAALRWLAERMQQQHHLAVTLEMDSLEHVRLSEDKAVLLFQSVRELLINAAKHAQCDQATVSIHLHPHELRLEVRDKGVGFEPAALSVANPQSTKFGHFSIRERMTALGGSFEVTSHPGQGTVARLLLPFEEGLSLDPLEKTSEPRLESATKPLIEEKKKAIRVLLVDDHAMVRQGLRSVLEGYPEIEVLGEACDGVEAVNCVGLLLPSVVIMDINMPRMDGIEATRRIKAHHPAMTVIGVSVNASAETKREMLEAGAATLLTKEAAVEELYSAIARAQKLERSNTEVPQ